MVKFLTSHCVIICFLNSTTQRGYLYPSQLRKIEAHIRRRLRSRVVSQQKRKRHLYRTLVKRGVPVRQAAKGVFSNKKRWALSNIRAVTKAYPNRWFIKELGQEIRSDRKLVHWFDVSLSRCSS